MTKKTCVTILKNGSPKNLLAIEMRKVKVSMNQTVTSFGTITSKQHMMIKLNCVTSIPSVFIF